MEKQKHFSAFNEGTFLRLGSLEEVLKAAVDFLAAGGSEPILFFDHETGRQTDFFLQGTWEEILSRARRQAGEFDPDPRSGPGRPKLGIISREVTLLPKHWEWLESQPSRASGTLRKLVDEAMEKTSGASVRRVAAGRILTALCGNLPGYEEAARELYAGRREGFLEIISPWPQEMQKVLLDCLGN